MRIPLTHLPPVQPDPVPPDPWVEHPLPPALLQGLPHPLPHQGGGLLPVHLPQAQADSGAGGGQGGHQGGQGAASGYRRFEATNGGG